SVLLTLPNLLPRSAIPSWLPARQISLGLDLRGGSYLLLEVDLNAVIKERLESLADGARTRLRQANVGYINLATQPEERRLSLRLRDPSQAPAALAALRELANPITTATGGTLPDLEVANTDGLLTVTLSEA